MASRESRTYREQVTFDQDFAVRMLVRSAHFGAFTCVEAIFTFDGGLVVSWRARLRAPAGR